MPKKKMTASDGFYVYIAEAIDGSSITKIGFSRNPFHRITTQINPSSAKQMRVVWVKEFKSEVIARAMETAMKREVRKYDGYHSHNEWFNCHVSYVLRILDIFMPDYFGGHYEGPYSTWPRGTDLRPVPHSVDMLPLPDNLVQEDLEFVRSNISVPSQK